MKVKEKALLHGLASIVKRLKSIHITSLAN